MSIFVSIIGLIIILGVLVFVHELGHFTVAKWFGVRVDEFGMGLPPRAIKLFKRGETEYTLNWVPFGGFVKIHGEDSLDKNDPDYHRSLVAKKWWQQILVLIAGVTMNAVLAWILFSGSLMVGAPTAMSDAGNVVLKNPVLTVLEVAPNSPAEKAGLEAGDKILKVSSSSAILSNAAPDAFTSFIQSTKSGDSLSIEIKRGAQVKDLAVIPSSTLVPGHQAIGVAIDMVGIAPGLSFFKAFENGFLVTINTIRGTFDAFGLLITGHLSLNSLSGPVGLTKVVGQAERIGFMYVVMITAVISINLAVINILPLPALDGGRILFVIIETIIRRPLSKKFVEWANGIGFSLLIILMLVITVKDVIHLL